MLYAVIDVGSNAARLLFANAFVQNGKTQVEKASLIRIPIRLGQDAFSIGKISDKKADEFIKCMKAFALLIEVYKPANVAVMATAAMRTAKNRDSILKRIYETSGLEMEVISGATEASIIRTTNKVFIEDNNRPLIFIDVGGGSTEISLEYKGKLISLKSFKIGTLRILNNNFKEDIFEDIFHFLESMQAQYNHFMCIGSGGNINKLNKVFGNPQTKILKIRKLKAAYDMLNAMTVEERMKAYGFRRDRADVIVPAAFIFLKILNFIKANEIIVPKIGLADGMAHILHEEYLHFNS